MRACLCSGKVVSVSPQFHRFLSLCVLQKNKSVVSSKDKYTTMLDKAAPFLERKSGLYNVKCQKAFDEHQCVRYDSSSIEASIDTVATQYRVTFVQGRRHKELEDKEKTPSMKQISKQQPPTQVCKLTKTMQESSQMRVSPWIQRKS